MIINTRILNPELVGLIKRALFERACNGKDMTLVYSTEENAISFAPATNDTEVTIFWHDEKAVQYFDDEDNRDVLGDWNMLDVLSIGARSAVEKVCQICDVFGKEANEVVVSDEIVRSSKNFANSYIEFAPEF